MTSTTRLAPPPLSAHAVTLPSWAAGPLSSGSTGSSLGSLPFSALAWAATPPSRPLSTPSTPLASSPPAVSGSAAPVACAADILADLVEPIGWAARNSAKPGRTGPEAWVVHASPAWSKQHLEDSPAAVVTALQLALAHAVGGVLPGVISSTAHRWRYALPAAASREFLWNGSRQIGICGDWLAGPRVDAAWLSGHRLAGAIIG